VPRSISVFGSCAARASAPGWTLGGAGADQVALHVASPPNTASIKRPVLVPVSAHDSAKDRNCTLASTVLSATLRLAVVEGIGHDNGSSLKRHNTHSAPYSIVRRGSDAQTTIVPCAPHIAHGPIEITYLPVAGSFT
jgi:hypothetical protein